MSGDSGLRRRVLVAKLGGMPAAQKHPHLGLFLVPLLSATARQTPPPPTPNRPKCSSRSDCPTQLVRKPEAVATLEGAATSGSQGRLATPGRYKREQLPLSPTSCPLFLRHLVSGTAPPPPAMSEPCEGGTEQRPLRLGESTGDLARDSASPQRQGGAGSPGRWRGRICFPGWALPGQRGRVWGELAGTVRAPVRVSCVCACACAPAPSRSAIPVLPLPRSVVAGSSHSGGVGRDAAITWGRGLPRAPQSSLCRGQRPHPHPGFPLCAPFQVGQTDARAPC